MPLSIACEVYVHVPHDSNVIWSVPFPPTTEYESLWSSLTWNLNLEFCGMIEKITTHMALSKVRGVSRENNDERSQCISLTRRGRLPRMLYLSLGLMCKAKKNSNDHQIIQEELLLKHQSSNTIDMPFITPCLNAFHYHKSHINTQIYNFWFHLPRGTFELHYDSSFSPTYDSSLYFSLQIKIYYTQ